MNLRQLDVFVAVLREGTATGAAERLNTTQPNVTKIVRQLEDGFGLKLFDRSGGRMHPTAEAEALFGMAEQIQDEVSEFERFARSLSRMSEGFLRVATQPTYSNTVLPLAISEFRSRYPGVQIRLDVLGRENILKLDTQSPVDVAFVHFMGDRAPPFVTQTIAEHPMICILPENHPLANRDEVAVAEALTYPRIGFPPDHVSSRLVEQATDARSHQLVPDITVNYTSLAADLVRQGIGLAIVEPLSFDESRRYGIVLKPLKERVLFKTGIALPNRQRISLTARAFIEILTDTLN